MKTSKFKCRCCGRILEVCVSGQKYCSLKDCQKSRKNRWRRHAYATDIDYRINQKNSTDIWLETQGGAALYYQNYRSKKREELQKNAAFLLAVNPDSSLIAEALQTETQAKTKTIFSDVTSRFAGDSLHTDKGANSDAIPISNPITSGVYRISPANANSDAVVVKISVISDG